jgi:murein DD-endopeptidase MepM/ murein hydrolase activator NlpD
MRLLKAVFTLGCAAWTCGFCFFVVVPNLIVSTTIPQVPFGGSELAEWQSDIPQNSDGADGSIEVRAGASRVGRDGYGSLDAQPPYGIPLHGPITHWGDVYDKPLLGCRFRDPNYISHTGADFPLDAGQSVYATMGGKVVWSGDNGPWGNLLVVENNGYQTWFAHLSQVNVSVGQIVSVGDVVGLVGNTGNSTGNHLHYGIKQFKDESDTTGVWLNPELFFSADDVIYTVCGN